MERYDLSAVERFLLLLTCAALPCAHASIRAASPMTVLQQQADLIVVATVRSVVTGAEGRQTVSLEVERSIQGSPTSAVVAAVLEPPDDPAFQFPDGVISKGAVGRRGVWFLKSPGSGYRVVPIVHGVYVRDADIYIPVSSSEDSVRPVDGETTIQQLTRCAILAYLATPNPGGDADDLLLPSLLSLTPQQAVDALGPLLSSPSADHQAFGLAMAIRRGSDSALSSVAADLVTLKNSGKFPLIVGAIKEYQPHGGASVEVLKQLVGRNSGAPGLDGAVAAALAKTASRAAMPVMISLLDSPEPEAVIRAATFCGFYTLFADREGNLNVAQNGSLLGPLSNAQTKEYTPKADSALTPEDYARFWKSWWSQHQSELGFQAP